MYKLCLPEHSISQPHAQSCCAAARLQYPEQLLPLLQLYSTPEFWHVHESKGTGDSFGPDVASGSFAVTRAVQSCSCAVA